MGFTPAKPRAGSSAGKVMPGPQGIIISGRRYPKGGRGICLDIGREMAGRLGIRDDGAGVDVAYGDDADRGKIRLAGPRGPWRARKLSTGHTQVTVSVLPDWLGDLDGVRLAVDAELLTPTRGEAYLVITLPRRLIAIQEPTA